MTQDYTIGQLFEAFPMLKARGLAQYIDINATLLQNYRTDSAPASDTRKAQIEKAVHALGEELQRVHII